MRLRAALGNARATDAGRAGDHVPWFGHTAVALSTEVKPNLCAAMQRPWAPRGSLVLSDNGMEVGMAGMRDLIVVATPGAVVVPPEDRAQEVKTIIERLRTRRRL